MLRGQLHLKTNLESRNERKYKTNSDWRNVSSHLNHTPQTVRTLQTWEEQQKSWMKKIQFPKLNAQIQ